VHTKCKKINTKNQNDNLKCKISNYKLAKYQINSKSPAQGGQTNSKPILMYLFAICDLSARLGRVICDLAYIFKF
jgi:hypothetical protein